MYFSVGTKTLLIKLGILIGSILHRYRISKKLNELFNKF